MLSKTENLPLIGLFISIFIAIIMGFVIGALVENLGFKEVNDDVQKLLREETAMFLEKDIGQILENSLLEQPKVELNKESENAWNNLSKEERNQLLRERITQSSIEELRKNILSLSPENYSRVGLSKNKLEKLMFFLDNKITRKELNFSEDELNQLENRGYNSLLLKELNKSLNLNISILESIFLNLKKRDPLIIGLNIIDPSGIILYSDEPSLVGKSFSDKAKISKAIKNSNYYTVDRNLISQETILKEDYKNLLITFNYFSGPKESVIQIMYDISPREKGIRQITSLLWFTIFLSVGVLFFLLVYISNLTRRTLQKAKEDLEVDIYKTTKDLQELSADLDRQVKERTKDLESANKEIVKKSINLTETTGQLDDKNYELEQANKEILSLMEARTDFINKAAHDLRTPITPILVLLPTIKKRIKDIDILFDLKVIERNANYLKNIADNLINYLKSKSQKYDYNFKKNDIRTLIEDVLITYREVFKQRRITIIKKIPKNLPLIELDGLKITEVIQNIISNVLKFVSRVGKLTVSVKKMDNFINVRFKDTGIGIKKEALEGIFREFFKADVSRHTEGEGLGLSICKGIIEDHHGKIWAESDGMGKGSTICFNIPIKQKR